jgi:hypothetical protein
MRFGGGNLYNEPTLAQSAKQLSAGRWAVSLYFEVNNE